MVCRAPVAREADEVTIDICSTQEGKNWAALEVVGAKGERACKVCGRTEIVKVGKDAKGQQVWRCKTCRRRFIDNGCPYRARTPTATIAAALEFYFSGASTAKASRLLRRVLRVYRSDVSVWRWAVKYPHLVRQFVDALQASTSPTWHADETVIDTHEGKMW